MANNVNVNPLVLDTAAVITTEHKRIKGVRWVGTATLADQCIVHDNNGVVWWESIAAATNNVDAMVIETGVNGIDLAQIDSGVLYIYLE